jgi:hypothetical protein
MLDDIFFKKILFLEKTYWIGLGQPWLICEICDLSKIVIKPWKSYWNKLRSPIIMNQKFKV